MFKNLILFAGFMASGCANTSQMANKTYLDIPNTNLINVNKTTNVEEKAAGPCNFNHPDAKEKIINLFNFEGIDISTYKPDKDPDLIFIKKIKACPREDAINSLLALQDTNKNDIEIKAKTAYFLIKLGHNKSDSGKTLISTYSARHSVVLERYKDPNYEENVMKNKYDGEYKGDQIISLIGDAIENEDTDKAILTESFKLISEVDGASATGLFETFASEFKEHPEKFLKAIKGELEEVQKTVFERMCSSIPKKSLIKNLSAIPKSSDVYSLSKEISGFIQQSQVCEDAQQYFQ